MDWNNSFDQPFSDEAGEEQSGACVPDQQIPIDSGCTGAICPIKLDLECVLYSSNKLGCTIPPGYTFGQLIPANLIIEQIALLLQTNVCNPPVLPCFKTLYPDLPATPVISDITLFLQNAICAIAAKPVAHERFALEDNLAMQERVIDMQNFSLSLNNANYLKLYDASGIPSVTLRNFFGTGVMEVRSVSSSSIRLDGAGAIYLTNAAGLSGQIRVDYVTAHTGPLQVPNFSSTVNRFIPISVNGIFADANGDITVTPAQRMITVATVADLQATSHAVADHVIMYKTTDKTEAINGLYTWNAAAGDYTATDGGFWKKEIPAFLHATDYIMQRKLQLYNTVNSGYSASKPPIHLFLRNDIGESIDPTWGAMICGSAYGGAINFQNTFTGLDGFRNLQLGMVDNNFIFTNMLEMHYSISGNSAIARVPITPPIDNAQSVGLSNLRFDYGWYNKMMVNTSTDLGWKLEVQQGGFGTVSGAAHFSGYLHNAYPYIVKAEVTVPGNNITSGNGSVYYGFMYIPSGGTAATSDFMVYHAVTDTYDRGSGVVNKMIGFKAEVAWQGGNDVVGGVTTGIFGFEGRVFSKFVNTAGSLVKDVPAGYNFHGLPVTSNQTIPKGRFVEFGHILLDRIDPVFGAIGSPTPVPFAIKQLGTDNYNYFEGTVTLGTTTPSPSARLQVDSTTKGILPPRMTTAQRDAIVSPTEGLTIWNIDTHVMNYYNGSVWGTVTSMGKASSIGVNLDGQGFVLTTGQKGYVMIPYSGIITGWSIIADQVGTCIFDVWKKAGAKPIVTDTITASAKPALSGTDIASSSSVGTWNIFVTAGDVIGWYLETVTTITRMILQLTLQGT